MQVFSTDMYSKTQNYPKG